MLNSISFAWKMNMNGKSALNEILYDINANRLIGLFAHYSYRI